MGILWCRSSSTKTTKKTAAVAKSARISGELHPFLFDSISPYVSANNATPELARPSGSSRCSEVSRDSSMKMRAAKTPSTPIGTLMKKIQLQLMCCVITPPISGPIASAIAETPAQIPIAIPRCRGGNVAVMIESVAGFISAAPMPCTVRAPISRPAPFASPHASDEPVKTTRPTMKIRRRPSRSASLPPVSSNTPNVNAYALTTHSSSEIVIPRSR